MPNQKGKGPKGMDPHVVKRLLDGLTKDEEFRQHFQRDPKSALESVGYVAPEGDEAHAASCLQVKSGATLASPEEITDARSKLETALNGIHGFDSPLSM